ncbi:MAG: translocation/assembly module TamB domain-containing protein, partial [Bacteroidetes bacterium]|nr:translocation/assembly module TamB domain-containing protein [Bacteroidota bacterium]
TINSVQDLALRRELQLALTTQLLNDRVTINLGGNVDFGANQLDTQSSNSDNTTYFGGNFSIEYELTENRRFRIKAFTNTNYDYFNQGNSTRAGVGLSFKREFDKISEFKIDKEEFKIKQAKNDSIKKQEKAIEP